MSCARVNNAALPAVETAKSSCDALEAAAAAKGRNYMQSLSRHVKT